MKRKEFKGRLKNKKVKVPCGGLGMNQQAIYLTGTISKKINKQRCLVTLDKYPNTPIECYTSDLKFI